MLLLSGLFVLVRQKPGICAKFLFGAHDCAREIHRIFRVDRPSEMSWEILTDRGGCSAKYAKKVSVRSQLSVFAITVSFALGGTVEIQFLVSYIFDFFTGEEMRDP